MAQRTVRLWPVRPAAGFVWAGNPLEQTRSLAEVPRARSHAAFLHASSFEHLLQLLRAGDRHQLLRAAPMQRALWWRGADAWTRPAQARRDWGLVHNAATLAAMEARL